MVEANDQPQDRIETPEGNDEVQDAIELLEKKFGRIYGSINQRINSLTEFKEVVSKRLVSLLKDLDDFKDIFTAFAADA